MSKCVLNYHLINSFTETVNSESLKSFTFFSNFILRLRADQNLVGPKFSGDEFSKCVYPLSDLEQLLHSYSLVHLEEGADVW